MKILKPNKEFKEHIDRLLEYLQPRMHLHEYKFKWRYVDRIGGQKGLREVPGTENGYTAQVLIDTTYLYIEIDLSVKCFDKFKGMEYSTVALDLIHELAHAYTDEMHQIVAEAIGNNKTMQEFLRTINESNVEKIARTVFETMPREIWIPLKKRKRA